MHWPIPGMCKPSTEPHSIETLLYSHFPFGTAGFFFKFECRYLYFTFPQLSKYLDSCLSPFFLTKFRFERMLKQQMGQLS